MNKLSERATLVEVPKDLHLDLKLEAVHAGTSIRAFVAKALRGAIDQAKEKRLETQEQLV